MGGGQPFQVLIAEDDPEMARLYEEVVAAEVQPSSVVFVTTEEEAVGFATRSCGSCNLVFMDGLLRPGSGVSAIRRIRAAGVNTPVVFVSGKPELVDEARCEPRVIALGKPVKVPELQTAIRQAIAMG